MMRIDLKINQQSFHNHYIYIKKNNEDHNKIQNNKQKTQETKRKRERKPGIKHIFTV